MKKSKVRNALVGIWENKTLLYQLWKRDFDVRYKNGLLGITWAFINPLLMLALYSFLFVSVFKMRWGAGPDVKGNYVILLFTGLIVHGFFAEFITRAPLLVSANTAYVKKVVFPLELLPLMPMLGALINFLVGIILTLIFLFHLKGAIPSTLIYLPVILIPFILLNLGISYILSATGVYIRDLVQVVGIISTIAMFASPVLFPMENLPHKYQMLLYVNPLTVIVQQLREIAILGVMPDWRITAIYAVVATIIFFVGIAWFQTVRKGFADVL